MKYIDLCVALYDYHSQDNEELSFKANDVLYILNKDNSDWYKAQLKSNDGDGTVGLVPSNYIEKSKPIGSVKALYDYQAHSVEELSFKENDLMKVYEKDDQDWYIAELSSGDMGLIPSNYVEESTQSIDSSNATHQPKWAIALYQFDPQDKEETYLKEHEHVLVTDYTSDADWWTIEHTDGVSGIIPATYVKFRDEHGIELEEGKAADKKTKKEEKDLKHIFHRKDEEEKLRQAEMEKRKIAQAKQKEIEAKKQAPLVTQSLQIQSPSHLPKRSDIPAPLPVNSLIVQNQSVTAFDSNKPDPAKTRWWTDSTGTFKVEAQFIGCSQGKIRLFKTNGVKIEVPMEKMCMDDLKYIEQETGQKLIENLPLVHLTKRFPWFGYFKRINIPNDASVRYAKSFEKEGLGEQDIDRLTYGRMKSLGMTEKHIRRLQRFVETRKIEPPSDDENKAPKLKMKKSVTFGSVSYINDHAFIEVSDEEDEGYSQQNTQWQIEQDERLARELQKQENQQSKIGQAFTQGLQRRDTGKPTLSHSASGNTCPSASTSTQQEPHKPMSIQPQRGMVQPSTQYTPSHPLPSYVQPNSAQIIKQAGFNDDAWTARINHPNQPPSFNNPSFSNPIANNTQPQLPSRPRPSSQTSQQNTVDPQLLAKWERNPSVASSNNLSVFNQTNSSQNSLQTFQQKQQASHYRPAPSVIDGHSFSSSSASFQRHQPTTHFTSPPSQQRSTLHTVQPVLPPPLVPQPSPNSNPIQPQMTASGRNWAAATPDNPFGHRTTNGNSAPISHNHLFQQNFSNLQTNHSVNVIDPTDKYAIFKTIDTSAPSILKPTASLQPGYLQPQSQYNNPIYMNAQQQRQ
ncbi:hypothetical protein G6F47_001851 [Rhizopus delemar]|nr:hypothetical protein G6F54_004193 [Rhizopus delemar]KAG1516859.1 hypothetical protein G6F53_001829 [Rhizopus delemar]KAG1603422.1 hypothetical protein G6F47_001851 [Rhizopus delemar]